MVLFGLARFVFPYHFTCSAHTHTYTGDADIWRSLLESEVNLSDACSTIKSAAARSCREQVFWFLVLSWVQLHHIAYRTGLVRVDETKAPKTLAVEFGLASLCVYLSFHVLCTCVYIHRWCRCLGCFSWHHKVHCINPLLHQRWASNAFCCGHCVVNIQARLYIQV